MLFDQKQVLRNMKCLTSHLDLSSIPVMPFRGHPLARWDWLDKQGNFEKATVEDKKEIQVSLGNYHQVLGTKIPASTFLGDSATSEIDDEVNLLPTSLSPRWNHCDAL